MKKIKLTQGKYALVDDEDFEFLNQWKWFVKENHGNLYAVRQKYITHGVKNRKAKRFYMHRQLLGFPKKQIDHWNGNGLDNQRKNLRVCTSLQNSWNQKISLLNTSGYKGVHKRYKKLWQARISIKKKRISLGYFKNKKEAALAYNKAAKKYFGEYAKEFYESKINSLEWTDEERRLSRNLDFIIVMLEEME